jgi:hypothetical protein
MEKAWLRFACTSHRKRPRTKDEGRRREGFVHSLGVFEQETFSKRSLQEDLGAGKLWTHGGAT